MNMSRGKIGVIHTAREFLECSLRILLDNSDHLPGIGIAHLIYIIIVESSRSSESCTQVIVKCVCTPKDALSAF